MITVKEIEHAASVLAPVIHRTDLTKSGTFSSLSGSEIYLKYENLQKTGSFKIRGAYNKIAKLAAEKKVGTVVASSAGNHAQGVAFAATQMGINSIIVMPRQTPIAKISATEGYGAKIILHGDCYDEAYEKALEIAQKTENAEFIHAFDDPDVIAGQGTIGLEILKDLPEVDVIFIPAGGGGLLAGIAVYVKSINPRVQIVGVQAEGASAIVREFDKDATACAVPFKTIADGIAVKVPGKITKEYIEKYVDKMITVSDAEIAATILMLLERGKQMVEPAGAAALAAAVSGKVDIKGKRAACILSGGNIDVSFIHRIIEAGLVSRGRRLKFSTQMLDVPGSLQHFAGIVADSGANIVSVQYDRMQAELELDETVLHIACEVSGFEHGKKVIAKLKEQGYKVILE